MSCEYKMYTSSTIYCNYMCNKLETCKSKSIEKSAEITNSLKRVLVADDQIVSRKILEKILINLGHEVVGMAENGDEAIENALALKPDIIISDIIMPVTNGIEAIKSISSELKEAICIITSSVINQRTIMDSYNNGAKYYIHKPISKDAIAEIFLSLE